VSSLLLTCRNKSAAERHYLPAIRLGGWTGEIHVATPGSPLPALETFQGLLMTGGDDIHPRWWDPAEPVHPEADPDGDRDDLEIPLIRRAWDLRLPILGICRGEQALNVALGGSLIQDLPSRFGLKPDFHRRGSSDRPELAHPIELEPTSRLARLLGVTEVEVNSRHHQAVLRVAPPLRAVAWHRNPMPGIIEAIEAVDPERWVLGVQWHPENLVGLDGGTGAAARAIFQGFAEVLNG
jgi:putative glutamine amidotransferase